MAGLTHNYVGLADRTLPSVGGKPKARSKSDWAWKPYSLFGRLNGRITITKGVIGDDTGLLVRRYSVAAKPAKREARG